MIFDYQKKVIQVKIVYYGPAMSGKTTSLKSLFSYFGKENDLESIESTLGRTLFFDFGILKFSGTQWGVKFLLYSATGQDFYASTRPATLNGVDGIIFIADSQLAHIHYNLRSWNELKSIFGDEIYNIPIIIALNKYDIPNVEKINQEDIKKYFNISFFKFINIKKTIALTGEGVVDSFKAIINSIFPQITLISKHNAVY